jgi:hypothetical protein
MDGTLRRRTVSPAHPDGLLATSKNTGERPCYGCVWNADQEMPRVSQMPIK